MSGNRLQPDPSPPPRRTRFIDAVNRGTKALWRGGLLAPPVLDADALLRRVATETGLDDYGDPWFREPLAVLLAALRGEARLNPAGMVAADQQIRKVLRDRLWAQAWFARHPHIRDRPLHRPVVIVGPMRSGTTRLHRLLASDRRFAHLRNFETISPVPRPDFARVQAGTARDFRIVLARRILRVAHAANPRTLSIHPTGPLEPEEELGLLVASFYGMKHEAQWQVPSYARWAEAADATPAYRHMADLLRLVGWSQGQSSARPWLLKTPQHMLDLDALLAVFPDARLIFTHRDPRAIVGSAASLAWNQTILYSDHVDPADVGREWLRKTQLQIERMQAIRAHVPADRQIDVQYDEMDRDWRGAMGRVYRFLGLDLVPALPAMDRYVARAAASKRRPHCYDLAQFGLGDADVLDQLGGYVSRYGISMEDGAPPPG